MASSAGPILTASPCKLRGRTAIGEGFRHVVSAHRQRRLVLRYPAGLRPPGPRKQCIRLTAKGSQDQEDLTPYQKKVLERRKQTQAEYEGDPTAFVPRRNREKDLYTDQWDGDKWKGSKLNGLTVITVISILAPVIGLLVAYFSYGSLWG
ncbi:hypothetical protein WJX73_007703 [Symbiochloris irregularis]|uniref:Uncharacterized protein n=1 Tax=Symbiochloris irregularis TaxID=706552 RepID=A0AAW1PFK2_9CHLO